MLVAAHLASGDACLNILDWKDAVRARLMLFNDISHYADHPGAAKRSLSK